MTAHASPSERMAKPAMALGGGLAAAFIIGTMPGVYLETVVAATGIAEVIPAAAPPLGATARSLIALFVGVLVGSILFLFLQRKGAQAMAFPNRKAVDDRRDPPIDTPEPPSAEKKKRFNLLNFLRRGNDGDAIREFSDLPKLRAADRHPDAPARAPLRADTDLARADGTAASPLASRIRRFEQAEQEQQPAAEPQPHWAAAMEAEIVSPAEDDWQAPVAAPVTDPVSAQPYRAAEDEAPAPAAAQAAPRWDDEYRVPEMPDVSAWQAAAPAAEPVAAPQPEAASSAPSPRFAAPAFPAPAAEPVAAPLAEPSLPAAPDLSQLSIGELADRLADGLGRLQQLAWQAEAPSPRATPQAAAPVQAGQFGAPAQRVAATDMVPEPMAPALNPDDPAADAAPIRAPMDDALRAALGTLERLTVSDRKVS